MRDIKQLIIHCSASDNPEHDSVEVIKNWHLERGWDDIGYHYYIDKLGRIFEGRKPSKKGAHCKGHNSDSLGICLGGLNEFTPEQFESLQMIVSDLCFAYGIDFSKVFEHNYYNKGKTCPNFNIRKELRWN